ncbi:MAG: LamG domain-containing protein [Candidatus Aenigmatarchaeota archaeon]
MNKAISAVIATVMLLMTTVSLIGVFYVFSSTLATQTTSSGSEQASQLTAQLSMCMQIDNIIGNQVTLRNCGEGVIENKSLVVMMDDIALGANTNTIQEGNSSVVNVSGLWQVPFGKHSLKISNGAAVALALVEIIPNPDGLAGSWNFDEGSGTKAYDNSGNGNIGTLLPAGSEPTWTTGKFGEGLQFDGADDYVDAGNASILNITDTITIGTWINIQAITGDDKILMKGSWWGPYTIWIRESPRVLYFIVGNSSSSYSSPSWSIPSLSTWYYIVGVAKSGSYSKIYVNGFQVISVNSSVIIGNSSASSLQFGHDSGGYGFFNGTVDEVRIWNKAFAPDDTVAMKQII